MLCVEEKNEYSRKTPLSVALSLLAGAPGARTIPEKQQAVLSPIDLVDSTASMKASPAKKLVHPARKTPAAGGGGGTPSGVKLATRRLLASPHHHHHTGATGSTRRTGKALQPRATYRPRRLTKSPNLARAAGPHLHLPHLPHQRPAKVKHQQRQRQQQSTVPAQSRPAELLHSLARTRAKLRRRPIQFRRQQRPQLVSLQYLRCLQCLQRNKRTTLVLQQLLPLRLFPNPRTLPKRAPRSHRSAT